jgi:hypothetical protein
MGHSATIRIQTGHDCHGSQHIVVPMGQARRISTRAEVKDGNKQVAFAADVRVQSTL